MQSALYRIKSFMLMTVRGPAERSSRFYEENVQYNDRTNKKLTFTEDEQKTSYEIDQKMSYADLQEHR